MTRNPENHTTQRVFRMHDDTFVMLRRLAAHYRGNMTSMLRHLIHAEADRTPNLAPDPGPSPKARPGVPKAAGKKSRKKSKKSG
jgi:hypothetical protein